MSIVDKLFHNKNRAVRILARTPVVGIVTPLVIVAIVAVCVVVGAGVALRDDGWPAIKDIVKALYEGWLA